MGLRREMSYLGSLIKEDLSEKVLLKQSRMSWGKEFGDIYNKDMPC